MKRHTYKMIPVASYVIWKYQGQPDVWLQDVWLQEEGGVEGEDCVLFPALSTWDGAWCTIWFNKYLRNEGNHRRDAALLGRRMLEMARVLRYEMSTLRPCESAVYEGGAYFMKKKMNTLCRHGKRCWRIYPKLSPEASPWGEGLEGKFSLSFNEYSRV